MQTKAMNIELRKIATNMCNQNNAQPNHWPPMQTKGMNTKCNKFTSSQCTITPLVAHANQGSGNAGK